MNAQGAQLTAADLIKNFIFFLRLLETGTNAEDAYQRNWKEFETGFWETEINVSRLRYPRSAIFLSHWLIAQTGEEIVARGGCESLRCSPPNDLALNDIYSVRHVH